MMVLITWCVPDREILAQQILWIVTNQTAQFTRFLWPLSKLRKVDGIKACQSLELKKMLIFSTF
jgi:hypothetical protein